MRPTSTLYAATAALTTAGTLLRDDRLHAVTKYAIAPLAAADVAARPGAWSAGRRARTVGLIASLVGSGLGDHLMIAESRATGPEAAALMRRGATAFSAQQIGFIALMLARGQRLTPRATRQGVAALAGLGAIDAVVAHRQGTSTTPDPVLTAYGALLVGMAALAQSDARTALGGRVFLASDAVIVARQLLPQGPARRTADAVVMASYTAALKLLVDGLAD